ncbi:hypothetical protein T492DRAFT_1146945 [Pavlovales sp. CCMP2436]|nr:hypothetical protein T492DRAFT_1146945 [Pavlovales sp. CCMP2436]
MPPSRAAHTPCLSTFTTPEHLHDRGFVVLHLKSIFSRTRPCAPLPRGTMAHEDTPADGVKCPCCRNPWSRPRDFDFAMACGDCTADDAGVSGLDPANMDPTVSPAADFYRHANGAWMDSNPIPGEYPAWNTFTALHDANLGRLKALLEELAVPSSDAIPVEAQSVAHKVAAFWQAANDEAAIEAVGLAPLAPVLAACELAATDKTAAVAMLQAEFGVNVFFALGEGPDDKDSGWTLHQLAQSGLGLPDRDYYFDADKADKRALYAAHVAATLQLLGDSAAEAEAGSLAVLKVCVKLNGTYSVSSKWPGEELARFFFFFFATV